VYRAHQNWLNWIGFGWLELMGEPKDTHKHIQIGRQRDKEEKYEWKISR